MLVLLWGCPVHSAVTIQMGLILSLVVVSGWRKEEEGPLLLLKGVAAHTGFTEVAKAYSIPKAAC